MTQYNNYSYVIVQLVHYLFVCTAGGSRYRPGGSGGGMGMGPSDIGGGADPLTGTVHVYTFMSIHVCQLYVYMYIAVFSMIYYVWLRNMTCTCIYLQYVFLSLAMW